MDAPSLAMEREHVSATACVVAAHGQIDLYAAEMFHSALARAVAAGYMNVTADLFAVDFDRVVELVPELDNVELHRLLAAVGEVASGDDLDVQARRELNALRRTVLDQLRASWDASGSAIPACTPGPWLGLARERGFKALGATGRGGR